MQISKRDLQILWRFFWLLVFGLPLAFTLVVFGVLALIGRDRVFKPPFIIITGLFWLLDFVINAVCLTIIYLELPKWGRREFLVTDRLKRYKVLLDELACYVCQMLGILDPGHC